MATIFQVMLLVFGIFSAAFAVAIDGTDGNCQGNEIETRRLRDGWSSSITWVEGGRSFVVKLDTPGYPLYIMNKSTAPALERESVDYYYPTEEPSAILLNITLSSDNQTLFLNHRQILPLLDTSIPPRIEAYQVPANTSISRIKDLVSVGLLQGIYYDQKHGSSDAPDRSYLITDVKFKTCRDSYPYTSGPTPNNETYVDNCSIKSWRCSDKDMRVEGAPWYRYVWRHKFDRYGRVGSLRHQLLQRCSEVSRFFNDTWEIWLISFASTFAAGILAYGIYRFVKFYIRFHAQRSEQITLAAEQGRLLDGSKDEDEEANVGDSIGWKGDSDSQGQNPVDLPPTYDACMKPLPLSPRTLDELHRSEDHSEPDLIVFDEDGFEPFQSNVGTV
ncbi:uncharacterized protein K441DRAFT_697397 [Cenococcum geophilum 1.58]|uniref:uncharacterized protein n=1 Tax=Cenococcum geophilum 1.58 TaxID=794803 RepID=UPI00358FA384|nr:hypothetical protein K441DRAFT_697397 [Cenococcum geophilum 1.58]